VIRGADIPPAHESTAVTKNGLPAEHPGKLGGMRRLLAWTVAALVVAAGTYGLAQQAPAKKPPSPPPAASAQPPKLTMPPIPNPGFAPGRPVDQARAVYQFAGEHPEVLKYVPCYCGCESSGHPHNESCFVKRRDSKGNVLEWDTHGYG
jgi:hypothetical protein